jgi:TusA-related sulfurtransferase
MAEKILITLGMKCPKPLFEVHKTIKSLDAGELLQVIADDPAFKLDIQAWCRRTGHDLLDLRREPDRMIATIRKADASPKEVP